MIKIRKILSDLFLRIAEKLYPENPKVREFNLKQMRDLMICGQTITRIDPAKTITDIYATKIPQKT